MQIRVSDAQAQLPELIEAAGREEEILIVSADGTQVARLSVLSLPKERPQ